MAALTEGGSEEQGSEAAEGADVTAHPGGAGGDAGSRKYTRKRSCFSMVNMMEPVDEEEKPADFGTGSVFDVKVRSADEFHFELPVKVYLEETLVGMHGAPKEKHSLEPNAEGRRWSRMKKLFSMPATHMLVKALFWVCISCVFPEEDYVSDEEKEALLELRRRMAESWVSLSQGRGPRALVHASDSLDEALTLFPVALSQVVFRLLIDAFSDDRDAMMRHAKRWFDKVSDVVHREFWGFRANRASGHILRSKLFIKAVVDHPHANQLESMKSELRLEKYSAARQEPLAFGSQTGEPLDDVQLLELFRWRQSQMPPHDSTHRAWSPQPTWTAPRSPSSAPGSSARALRPPWRRRRAATAGPWFPSCPWAPRSSTPIATATSTGRPRSCSWSRASACTRTRGT
ncbi:unnamed protein product [Prorocentrum cordatum]|uniref:Uncharacterized protein n=1 Tax=Prorocentrum cordatum TaxID=2364126 RepID=A0ABN9Y709_9DINO|nr:unnamed protein product [Polarella glacialis]